jgi:hypothetical protein
VQSIGIQVIFDLLIAIKRIENEARFFSLLRHKLSYSRECQEKNPPSG